MPACAGARARCVHAGLKKEIVDQEGVLHVECVPSLRAGGFVLGLVLALAGGQASWRPFPGFPGPGAPLITAPPLHCGAVPSHRRSSLVASLHLEGPSHECGRETRYRGRWPGRTCESGFGGYLVLT